MRPLARAAVAILVASASACSALVDVDDYRVDRDPCPPPTTCTGGASYAYVVWVADAPRLDDTTGTLDGFDLDATEEAVCRHEDHVSPDGERGVDNEFAPLAVAFEAGSMIDIRETTIDSILSGANVLIAHLEHVDDLENDDCVQFTNREGYVPTGVVLDADADRRIDPGLTLDYGTYQSFDETACIVDGVLHARFGDVPTTLPFLSFELVARRMRVKGRVSEGALVGANGGSYDVDHLVEGLNAAIPGEGDVGLFVRPAADLDPVDGTCQSISWAFTYEAIRVELGEYRTDL